jgi:GH35 family endo-1,4-beta-xylanase
MKRDKILSIFFTFLLIIVCPNTYSQIPTGGTDIIKDPGTFYSKIGKSTLSVVTVDGQVFSKAFRFSTKADVVSSWDAQLAFTPAAAITTNDVILVTFYARTTASLEETGSGSLTVCIENKTSYDKVVYQAVGIGVEWKQYFIPLKSNATLPLTNMNCAFHLGYVSQTIEIADVRYINYFTTKTIADLPQTEITYIGREADAPWRAEAQQRISQIRKGNIQIIVVDTLGNPVQNAQVTLAMTKHKFAFGSAINASNYLSDPVYKAKILEMFSEVVFENDLKWPSFIGKTAAQKNQIIQVLNDLDKHHITMRGHNVLWPSWTYNAAYLANYKTMPDKLRLEIDKHIDDVCTFTRGRIVDWDVINEPYSEHAWMDILGNEAMADWFKRVRNNDPYVKMYLNDFAILSSNGTNYPKQDAYIETVKYIDSLGGGVQGIGFQGHFGSDLTPIPRLKTILDKFAVLDKEIKVTEFDIDINQEAVKADYTRDFMTMLFSHPSVKGILMWGFWEGAHWKPAAAMYNKDWTIRPNGQSYRDLILDQWWTKDTTLMTNDTGVANFNGFLGSYRYSVKYDGREHFGIIDVNNSIADSVLNTYTLSTDSLVPAELKISVIGETVFCEGDSTQLSIDIGPDFKISWANNKALLAFTSKIITVKKEGMYSAEVRGKGVILRCPAVAIKVNPYPTVGIDYSGPLTFCPGGNVNLVSSGDIPYTYRWFKNGIFFSGSVPQVTVSESGKYYAEVNSLGCRSFSPELTVTKLNALDAPCSTGVFNPDENIFVSPNPFRESFFVETRMFQVFPVTLQIFDITGKVVFESTISDSSVTEVLPEVPTGIYLLKMKSGDMVQSLKVIHQ